MAKKLQNLESAINPSNAEATFVKAQGCRDFFEMHRNLVILVFNTIHWKALAESSQMSTHLPGFQSFVRFFASFCIGQISHQQHKG